jgi:transcriptional regulator with XRE-family HTH domain
MVQKKKVVNKVTKTVKKRAVITPEARESARVLLLAGVSRKEISETTGLSLSTLSRLAKEINTQEDEEFIESLEKYKYSLAEDAGIEWINRAYENPVSLVLVLLSIASVITTVTAVGTELTTFGHWCLVIEIVTAAALFYNVMLKK